MNTRSDAQSATPRPSPTAAGKASRAKSARASNAKPALASPPAQFEQSLAIIARRIK
jgi:hypothetical protein